jgi:glutamine synthetase
MTFRTVVREVALSQDIWASFMPKPFTDHPGSGMHTHLSLFEGDRNAFFEAGAEYQLSKTGRVSSSPGSCTTPPRSPR